MDDFDKWLRSVCFQKPTSEAYDLAKCAWYADKKGVCKYDFKNAKDLGKKYYLESKLLEFNKENPYDPDCVDYNLFIEGWTEEKDRSNST